MALVALAVAVAAVVVAALALLRVRSVTRLAAHVLDDARRTTHDDVDWQLQWIEPGVFVLTNTSPDIAAFDVEVSSTLTPVAGGPVASATAHDDRVNPGSWVEVRHAGVGQGMFDDLQQLRRSIAMTEEIRRRPDPLDAVDLALLASTGERIDVLQERVEFTLSYVVTWRSTGVVRHKTPLKQRLVPSPVA